MRIEKDCERGESNLDNAACDVAHSIEISCYVVSCVGVAFVHFDVYDWIEIGIECSIICRCSLGMDVSVYIYAALSGKLHCYYCKILVQYVYFWKVISV